MAVLVRKSDGKRLRGVFDDDPISLPFVRVHGYPPAGYFFGYLSSYLDRPLADEDALAILTAAEADKPYPWADRPGDRAVFGAMIAMAVPAPLPDGRPIPGSPPETYSRTPNAGRPRVYKTDVLAARAWARRNGYSGNGGGWIRNSAGRPTCQGWGKFADRLRASGHIKRVETGWGVS